MKRLLWRPPLLRPEPTTVTLTPLQAAVLTHVVAGYTNAEIARAMNMVSEDAVKSRVSVLMGEFGARNRTQLVALATTACRVVVEDER